MDFEQAYMIGRSRAFFLLGFERRENLLLSLKDVLQVVKPQGRHYVGIRDIPVEKIIGTEDRPEDFSIGFYPIRKGMNERWTEVKRLLLSA